MFSSSIPWWEVLARLGMATLLAGLMGWNRERARKPAGIKTHLLVGLGSALIMLVSIELYLQYSARGTNIDPGRIAAQVVTGIGFLGAGTIIHAQGGLVLGLTTAASVWAVAGIGLACGCGQYLLAIMATTMAIAALAFVNRFVRREGKARPTLRVKSKE